MAQDYKDTLQLPKTDFPMRASLPKREPDQVQEWLKNQTYQKMVKKNEGATPFILHDGPPYANGDLHMGHALNKTLKDIVIKYKNLSGFHSPYIPGWDCHGLPIELGVEKQLKNKKLKKETIPPVELRRMCREYAKKYVSLQMSQFQSIEVFGDWENPYITMSNEYTAAIVRELGKCAENGILYRGNKPVYWCPTDQTALAEAEIEYADKTSPSIYVKFQLDEASLKNFSELDEKAKKFGAKPSIVIWTTTPWTLPANLGISLHPEFDYVALGVKKDGKSDIWIIAKDLKGKVLEATGLSPDESEILLTFKAEKLHRGNANHPFIDRKSLIILGEHVTTEAGTGAVHTAPGHGMDDYLIGLKYGLDVLSPVDGRGCFTSQFKDMEGEFIFKANEPIIERLKTSGHLIARTDIQHSYPHSWRSHKPVFFRATPQWFLRVEPKEKGHRNLRKECIDQVDKVEWIPEWGINRILGMLESRPDWCVSRQRIWGVPITVFYCKKCDEALADPEIFEHVAKRVEKEGADFWFSETPESLLPESTKCRCGSTSFNKETDILDVWFDSGVSHAAVCENRKLGWPVDLYLEGSDQHRGWFQTSLLTAVATRKAAPFKAVLTHGFVNDQDGKKMSKSKGNVTSPFDILKSHGADILRLWVVLEDYRNDINYSKQSLDRVSETYRKVRNTFRFLLGNLYDFDPEKNSIQLDKMSELDRWALSRTAEFIEKARKAYDQYEFHAVYHALVNFLNTEFSSVYLDIVKDRLYCSAADWEIRRSTQTAMWLICSSLARALSPILSFTSEEVWKEQRKQDSKLNESIFLSQFPSQSELKGWRDLDLETRLSEVWKIRDITLKKLEEERAKKVLGHPREASVKLTLTTEQKNLLETTKEEMHRLFLVSELNIQEGTVLNVEAGKTSFSRCVRCWTHSASVGKESELCDRCLEAIK